MKNRLLFIVLTVLLAFPTLAAHSQQTGYALIFNNIGDLWMVDGPKSKPKPLTGAGFIDVPVLAPDGRQLAYSIAAKIYVDYVKRSGSDCVCDVPTNIIWYDRATGETIRVADQPVNSVYAPGGTSSYVTRSAPSWSPDSKSLAWGEIAIAGNITGDPSKLQLTYSVVTYDLLKQNATVIPYTFPRQDAAALGGALEVRWGKAGLAVLTSAEGSGKFTLMVLGLDGKVVSSTDVDAAAQHDFRWVTDNKAELLAYPKADFKAPWTVLDPASGKTADMQGVPELYSLSAPAGLSIFWTPIDDKTSQASIVSGDKVLGTVDGTSGAAASYGWAIAPDGKRVALQKLDPVRGTSSIIFWTNGQASSFSPPHSRGALGGIAWGAVGWRVHRGG